MCGGVMSAKSGRPASPNRSHLDVLPGRRRRGGSSPGKPDIGRIHATNVIASADGGREGTPRSCSTRAAWEMDPEREPRRPDRHPAGRRCREDSGTRSDPIWAHAGIAFCLLPGIGGDHGGRSQRHAEHRNDCPGLRRLPPDEFRGVCHARTQHPFDINDFDETLPAPWEWDIKRLATSFVLAARSIGLPGKTARDTAVACVRSYRRRLAELSRHASTRRLVRANNGGRSRQHGASTGTAPHSEADCESGSARWLGNRFPEDHGHGGWSRPHSRYATLDLSPRGIARSGIRGAVEADLPRLPGDLVRGPSRPPRPLSSGRCGNQGCRCGQCRTPMLDCPDDVVLQRSIIPPVQGGGALRAGALCPARASTPSMASASSSGSA